MRIKPKTLENLSKILYPSWWKTAFDFFGVPVEISYDIMSENELKECETMSAFSFDTRLNAKMAVRYKDKFVMTGDKVKGIMQGIRITNNGCLFILEGVETAKGEDRRFFIAIPNGQYVFVPCEYGLTYNEESEMVD